MIFYFTGTGNSLWAAKTMSRELAEPLVSIADALKSKEGVLSYPVGETEKVVFVYPVHSWGPAVSVLRFISRLRLDGYAGQPVYSVCTCGDECGYTVQRLRKALAERKISLTYAYSLQMPNNYILLPGFNVDPPEVEALKLKEAPERLSAILRLIRQAENSDTYYCTGTFPFVKSYLVYPLFTTFALRRNAFYVTGVCIACGLCERVCPTGTIRMAENGQPVWGGDTCVQCLACIHRCPVRAIEYGKQTQRKGRYCHPEINHPL